MEQKLTWEEWVKQYKPIKNQIVETDTLDGFMYETYGPEVEFVKAKFKENPYCVWTYYSEGDTTWIGEGAGWVNRLGYLVTEIPAIVSDTYTVDEYTSTNEEQPEEEE